MQVVHGGNVVYFQDASEKGAAYVHSTRAHAPRDRANDQCTPGVNHQITARSNRHPARERGILDLNEMIFRKIKSGYLDLDSNL